MVRIAALWVIAFVKNLNTFWYRTLCYFPSSAMRFDLPLAVIGPGPNSTIAFAAQTS